MGRHLRSLEGARGLAAFSIVAYHVGVPGSSRLWIGVPLFFLLSGFLLFRPFARAIVDGTPMPAFGRYAKSRILRIVPAYWLALTFELVHRHLLDLDRWHLAAHYFLVFTLFHLGSIVGGSWTLCIEIAFYAFLPFFVLLLAVIARRMHEREARALLIVAALLPAFPISVAYLGSVGRGPGTPPLWLPGYLDEFAIGMLLAVVMTVRPTISRRASRILLTLAVVLLVLSQPLYGFGAIAAMSNGAGVVYARLVELAFALALASVLGRGEGTAFGRFLANPVFTAAGKISYGVYLWNLAVIEMLSHTRLWTRSWPNLILTIATVSLVATGSWLLVEKPLLSLKDRSIRVRLTRPAAEPATEDAVG